MRCTTLPLVKAGAPVRVETCEEAVDVPRFGASVSVLEPVDAAADEPRVAVAVFEAGEEPDPVDGCAVADAVPLEPESVSVFPIFPKTSLRLLEAAALLDMMG